ncbi:hypothetical protein ACGFYF_38355 [Streptomyces lavendulae]|uniref:hypothetical protein n=1 Tax=Streptomyces lavendulae TaxID=1914 RepID=UPI00371EB6C6
MDAQITPLLERIGARERELATTAEQLRTQIDELTARLRELNEEMESLAVTRKTLLALPPVRTTSPTCPKPAPKSGWRPAHGRHRTAPGRPEPRRRPAPVASARPSD